MCLYCSKSHHSDDEVGAKYCICQKVSFIFRITVSIVPIWLDLLKGILKECMHGRIPMVVLATETIRHYDPL